MPMLDAAAAATPLPGDMLQDMQAGLAVTPSKFNSEFSPEILPSQ